MECPFCGKEMENGRFSNMRFYYAWLPENVKAPLLLNSITIEKAGGLMLGDQVNLLAPITLTARICRSCGKGVFDLSQGD